MFWQVKESPSSMDLLSSVYLSRWYAAENADLNSRCCSAGSAWEWVYVF